MQKALIGDGRSAKLETEDKKNLRALIRKAETKTAAADALGITRPTLNRILVTGTCAPSMLEGIRQYFLTNIVAA